MQLWINLMYILHSNQLVKIQKIQDYKIIKTKTHQEAEKEILHENTSYISGLICSKLRPIFRFNIIAVFLS